MRSSIAVLTVALVTMWAPRGLIADEAGAGSPAESMMDLQLTDEQEAKIADIRKMYKPKVQEANKQRTDIVKEEVEKIRDILTADQKAKLETLKEERKERHDCLAEKFAHLEELDLTDGEASKVADIRKDYQPRIAKALGGLKGVLSDEQRKAREAALEAGKRRSEVLRSLNLTDAQKQKMETVCKEVSGLVREETDKIKDMLTEAQQEKLQDFKDERPDRVRDRMAHRIANLQDLNLTEAQKAQIAEIRKEYRPKVHEAGNKVRATIREELEAIGTVLKG